MEIMMEDCETFDCSLNKITSNIDSPLNLNSLKSPQRNSNCNSNSNSGRQGHGQEKQKTRARILIQEDLVNDNVNVNEDDSYTHQYDNEEFYPDDDDENENEDPTRERDSMTMTSMTMTHTKNKFESRSQSQSRSFQSYNGLEDSEFGTHLERDRDARDGQGQGDDNDDDESIDIDIDEVDLDPEEQRKFEETIFQKAMIGIGPYLVEQAASVLSASRSYSGDLSYLPKRIKQGQGQTNTKFNKNAYRRNTVNGIKNYARSTYAKTPALPNIDESISSSFVSVSVSRSQQSLTKGFQKLRLNNNNGNGNYARPPHTSNYNNNQVSYYNNRYNNNNGRSNTTHVGTKGAVKVSKKSSSTSSLGRKHYSYTHVHHSSVPKYNMDNSVGQRLASARRGQIKELKSRVTQLENQLKEQTKENQTLARMQHRHEIALSKYENTEAELPKMIRSHLAEVKSLQENLRRVQSHNRNCDDKMKHRDQKIFRLEEENKTLLALVQKNDLEERSKLTHQLDIAKSEQKTAENRIADLQRHVEILEKNHRHQLSVEAKKLRATNNKLFEAHQEIDKLVTNLKEKERYISYMRIRQGHGSGAAGRNEMRLAMASMQIFRDDISLRSARTLPLKKSTRHLDSHHQNDQAFMSTSMHEDTRLRRQRSETCGPIHRRPAHTKININYETNPSSSTPRRNIFYDPTYHPQDYEDRRSPSPGRGHGHGNGQGSHSYQSQCQSQRQRPAALPQYFGQSVSEQFYSSSTLGQREERDKNYASPRNIPAVSGQGQGQNQGQGQGRGYTHPPPMSSPSPRSGMSSGRQEKRQQYQAHFNRNNYNTYSSSGNANETNRNTECDLMTVSPVDKSQCQSQSECRSERHYSGDYDNLQTAASTISQFGHRQNQSRGQGHGQGQGQSQSQDGIITTYTNDEYYNFENLSVEDDTNYQPHKSLYIDALDSSCNVSSMGQSPLDSMRSTHHNNFHCHNHNHTHNQRQLFNPIKLSSTVGQSQNQGQGHNKGPQNQNHNHSILCHTLRPSSAGPKFKLPANTNNFIPSPNPIFPKGLNQYQRQGQCQNQIQSPSSQNIFASSRPHPLDVHNCQSEDLPQGDNEPERDFLHNTKSLSRSRPGSKSKSKSRSMSRSRSRSESKRPQSRPDSAGANMNQGGGDGPPSRLGTPTRASNSGLRNTTGSEFGFVAQRDEEEIGITDVTPRTVIPQHNRNKNNLTLLSQSSSSASQSQSESEEDNDEIIAVKEISKNRALETRQIESHLGTEPESEPRSKLASARTSPRTKCKSEANLDPINGSIDPMKQSLDNNVAKIEAMFLKWKKNKRNACESSSPSAIEALKTEIGEILPGIGVNIINNNNQETTPRRKDALLQKLKAMDEAAAVAVAANACRKKTEENVTLSNPAYFQNSNYTEGPTGLVSLTGSQIFKPSNQPFFSKNNNITTSTTNCLTIENPGQGQGQGQCLGEGQSQSQTMDNLKSQLSCKIKQSLPWLNAGIPNQNQNQGDGQGQVQSSKNQYKNELQASEPTASTVPEARSTRKRKPKSILAENKFRKEGNKSGSSTASGSGVIRGRGPPYSSILEPRHTIMVTTASSSKSPRKPGKSNNSPSSGSGTGTGTVVGEQTQLQTKEKDKDLKDLPRKKFSIGTISSLQNLSQNQSQGQQKNDLGQSPGSPGTTPAGTGRKTTTTVQDGKVGATPGTGTVGGKNSNPKLAVNPPSWK